jgi:acyl-coenzyme A thioesterase PaaI-like protein
MNQNASLNMHELIATARREKTFAQLIERVPYARLIGMKGMSLGDELLFILPAQESNIGNPTLPALHGGCIGGFMENAAIFHVLATIESDRIPKVIDFSLDYLRPGRFRDTYASCEVVRQGRKVVNVGIKAWQTSRSEPIANARTHLLL